MRKLAEQFGKITECEFHKHTNKPLFVDIVAGFSEILIESVELALEVTKEEWKDEQNKLFPDTL